MPKRLVVCFDGTWNSADSNKADTNVVRLARSIHATTDTGGVPQMVLYLRGIGTTGLRASIIVEGATGLGVDDNIRSGYMFLAQNYLRGDEIFLFGFSRGAFSARSLAGFISACGLLKRRKLGDLGNAWKYYRREGDRSPAKFMAECGTDCHTEVEIKFLGVWDTVGAMGVPGHLFSSINHNLFAFHNTTPSKMVRHGCHALAIDEHRAAFVPTLWTGKAPAGATIEQVWFPGAHSDVGGGYITRMLADIPLVWMARKAEDEGLALDWKCLPDPTVADASAPAHDSATGFFGLERLTPTVRQICGMPFSVPFNQRPYAPPRTAKGEVQAPINEAVHQSVLARFGQSARTCTFDEKGVCRAATYRPRNVAALFDATGKLKPGIVVEKYATQSKAKPRAASPFPFFGRG